MKRIYMSLGIITLMLLSTSVADASEVNDLLARWRNHILTKGNMAGVELNEDYYTLGEMGPNILPEVFTAYNQEKDPHVLYYYGILIGRVAHFNFFIYSREPQEIVGYELQYTGADKPFLSLEYGKDGLPVLHARERAVMKRDKLVQWWNQRSSFTKREKVMDNIRSLTGRTRQEFLQFDKTKARELFKQRVYGIYNIPYYIDLIGQDNNPFAFCEFLRISNHPEFQAFYMTKDLVSNSFKVETKYPTRESKIDLIRDWWSRASKTYDGLDDLRSEIDNRIKKLSN